MWINIMLRDCFIETNCSDYHTDKSVLLGLTKSGIDFLRILIEKGLLNAQ